MNAKQLLSLKKALVKRADKDFVFIVQDKEGKKIATQKEIEIGARRSGEIEVLSGLNEGDEIINHGTVKVKDGVEITIKAIEDHQMTVGEMLNKDETAINQDQEKPE